MSGRVRQWLDPVVVERRSGDNDCERLARLKLWPDMYEEPTRTAAEVGTKRAIRLTAHTRCRNAMPRGVVICIEHRGTAYVLSATKPSCRSGAQNLFSGVDPLKELADQVRLLP